MDYTEAGMNGFPDTPDRPDFKRDEYTLLIVANNSGPASTSPCCTRCMWTRSSAGSGRCRLFRG